MANTNHSATSPTSPTALLDLPDAVIVHILCLAMAAKHSAASALLSACRALSALPARGGDCADLWYTLCATRDWDSPDRLYTMPVLSLGDPWMAQFRAWRRRAFSSDAEVAVALVSARVRAPHQRGKVPTWDVSDVDSVLRVAVPAMGYRLSVTSCRKSPLVRSLLPDPVRAATRTSGAGTRRN